MEEKGEGRVRPSSPEELPSREEDGIEMKSYEEINWKEMKWKEEGKSEEEKKNMKKFLPERKK